MTKTIRKKAAFVMAFLCIIGYHNNIYAAETESTKKFPTEQTTESIEDESPIIYEPIEQTVANCSEYATNFDAFPVPTDEQILNNANAINGYPINQTQSIHELPSAHNDIPENTNPNYAYGLSANTEYSGIITSEGELRWYAFDISEQTKVSVLTRSADILDTDIYLFQLDTSTMMLESTNLSARGEGTEEYFSCVIDSGIYYLAILGASGTGTYILDFFENTNYVDKEINDSISTAQVIDVDKNITGIIDTMRDADYYALTVTNGPMLVRISATLPGHNTLQWVPTASSPKRLSYENNMFILAPGTHYLALYDTEGEFYIGQGEYTFSINLISHNLANNLNASNFYFQLGFIIQYTPDMTMHYIDGQYINVGCSYYETVGSSGSPYFRKWSINLIDRQSIIFTLLNAQVDYDSLLEGKRIGTRVYFIDIQSADGVTPFGEKFVQQGETSRPYNICHAIIVVEAFFGTVVDVLAPDPNPFDAINPLDKLP